MAPTLSYIPGFVCLLLPSLAIAQPGATPPGSVPPSVPAPAPDQTPAPAPDYAPNYGPNYGQAPQPQQQPVPSRGRSGWNIGVAGLVGSMSSDLGELACAGCDPTPPAVGGEIHVGTIVSPKLALQGEVWFTSRDLDDFGDSSIQQTMYLLTAQYWLAERFWIKGGIGVSNLSLRYFDGLEDVNEGLESGAGLMASIGYEIIQSGNLAIDLQLKGGRGLYSDRNEEITTRQFAVGFHWY